MVKRKNFLPTLLVAFISWLGLTLLVIFTSPTSPLIFTTFYLLLFISLFLTLSLLLANSRHGFLLTTGIVVFLLLRQLNIAYLLNLILLTGILISLELYLRKK